MKNKFVGLFLIWLFVIIAYIIIAIGMPAVRELSGVASTELEASANMSNFPGTTGLVESSPIWIWFVPGLVGMIATVWTLKFGKEE